MKVLIALIGLLALCAGLSIPSVPGDNSHYIEGVSRYIWMPDGDGVPHLVDLHATDEDPEDFSRNGANNAYWLYTRDNPSTPQYLTHGDFHSVISSNYNPRKPLKVIAHGWRSNGNSGINPLLTSAFLEQADCNVIVLDWRKAAGGITYITAANKVVSVGRHLGEFLQWLVDTTGARWEEMHLVGFSLGAHVVGNAGRTCHGLPNRITGLDPAGPIWGGNSDAMNEHDGVYVEAIHTDGGALGIFDDIGGVNFYPNGGRSQPGCWVSSCNHSRAYEIFASTIIHNHLVGRRCNDLREARNQRCTGDEQLMMGNGILGKTGSGLFGLTTDKRWPF